MAQLCARVTSLDQINDFGNSGFLALIVKTAPAAVLVYRERHGIANMGLESILMLVVYSATLAYPVF